MRGPANPNMRFTTWTYGSTMQQTRGGGYSESRPAGNYSQTGGGYGFTGPRGHGFGGGGPRHGGPRHGGGDPRFFRGGPRGGRGGPRHGGPQYNQMGGPRGPLPDQEEAMPDDVKASIEKQKFKLDKVPGVIVKGEDGSLIKIAAPNPDEDVDLDAAPEPTRYDKSVQSILNGRNAAMFVGLECRKRQWEIEFECLEADGPVHNRVYSYSLTVGPPGSDDVLVTAGIARGKREAKRRCCEAMVLKLDDLPPAPPLGGNMMMRGGFHRPGFRPRLPPPESEETIFRNYDKTAYGDDHPNKNHPVFQLCSKAKKCHWPPPQFELVTEKIVDTIRNKHGKSNTMLYTYKVTVWPGVGQVEPKIFFGSGPTKKDAKFACGTIAWAAIMNPTAVKAEQAGTSGVQQEIPPGVTGEEAAQLAVKLASQVTGPKLKSAQHVTEEKWLQQVAKAAEKSVDLKEEVEKMKAEKKKKQEEEEAKRAEAREKRMAERKNRSRSRSRSRTSRRRSSRSRSRTRRSRSRSRHSRKRDRSDESRGKKERGSRDRDRSRSGTRSKKDYRSSRDRSSRRDRSRD